MRKTAIQLSVSLAIATFTTIGALTAAEADSVRYISTTGKNSNPCTLALPCRGMQRGITMTPEGGELSVLDLGFYGNNAIIQKSLTISGNGHTAYLDSSITINNVDAVVALRSLVLDGQKTIENGISIAAASTVRIERCVIQGFKFNGILESASGVKVFIVDSTVRHTNGDGANFQNAARVIIDNSRFELNSNVGVAVLAGRAAISRSVLANNLYGIWTGGAVVGVHATVAAHNTGAGFAAFGGAINIEASAAHGNQTGILVHSEGIARLSNSNVTGNTTGISILTGTVETRQNNTVRGNGTDISGALTPFGGV